MRMMDCPKCDEDFEPVWRCNTCTRCGTTFWTVEIDAEAYAIMKSRAENFVSMISPEARAKARGIVGR